MYQVEADKSKNLLTISYSQKVGLEEVKGCVEKVKAVLVDLKPGFRLLTDMTGLDEMDVACAVYLRRSMDWCNRKGVGQVVRIIPDPHKDIGMNIMSLFHYRHGIPIVTCANMAEATAILAG